MSAKKVNMTRVATPSLVLAFGYTPQDRKLYVQQNSGIIYCYTGVPDKVYIEFSRASLKSAHYKLFIEPHFAFYRWTPAIDNVVFDYGDKAQKDARAAMTLKPATEQKWKW